MTAIKWLPQDEIDATLMSGSGHVALSRAAGVAGVRLSGLVCPAPVFGTDECGDLSLRVETAQSFLGLAHQFGGVSTGGVAGRVHDLDGGGYRIRVGGVVQGHP